MRLKLNNLGKNQTHWNSISLMPKGGLQLDNPKYEILETDQISFRIDTPNNFISAKLIVENIEIEGRLCPIANDELNTSFEWVPRHNKKFGYDSLFLHFFGIAELAVELTDINNETSLILFEPINIYGRRVTAERAISMLSYITNKADQTTLEALSPTAFGSKLVKSGISPADILNRLEKTLSEIEPIIKKIIHNPITSLRSKMEKIYNPEPSCVDDQSIDWISEHTGLSVDASCSNDGLFQVGMHWKSMPEVNIRQFKQSTDLYENQVIAFHLNKIFSEGRRILEQCEQYRQSVSPKEVKDFGNGFLSFYNVARKNVQAETAKYSYRAKLCVERSERMLLFFNRMVPTKKKLIGKIALTEKIKANRHYLLLIKHLKEWLQVRQINWVEQDVLSSVNSTPVLFEYYTVLLTNSWLKIIGESSQTGLFNGVINGRKARLYYEPTYPSPQSGDSKYGIWSTDILVNKGRRPDIVIDLSYDDDALRELLILDAKCRNEKVVLAESLPECIPKYGYGIRDRNGGNPVKCVVMMHPKPIDNHDTFIDFYKPPYDCSGPKRAYPILGAQRINIDPEGRENGLHNLLKILVCN